MANRHAVNHPSANHRAAKRLSANRLVGERPAAKRHVGELSITRYRNASGRRTLCCEAKHYNKVTGHLT